MALVLIGCVQRDAIVPSLSGMTQAQARAALLDAGLTVGTVSQEYSDSVSEGRVVSQSLNAWTLAPPGSSVSFSVSLGADPIPRDTHTFGSAEIRYYLGTKTFSFTASKDMEIKELKTRLILATSAPIKAVRCSVSIGGETVATWSQGIYSSTFLAYPNIRSVEHSMKKGDTISITVASTSNYERDRVIAGPNTLTFSEGVQEPATGDDAADSKNAEHDVESPIGDVGVAQVMTDDFPDCLADARPDAYLVSVGQGGPFDEPLTVRLALPDDFEPDDLQLEYLCADCDYPGWYLARDIEGFLVPDSLEVLQQGPQAYLQFRINHSAILELVQVDKQVPGQ